MKKTIILASVTIATLFAFSSCQKEDLQDIGSVNSIRIITGEFEHKATKTTLNADGITPEWAVGDVIRILNSSSYQDVTLADGNISNNTITFTTTLTGTLYAVYPASATTMDKCTDGNITFTIPAIQDGTFGSANICVAKSIATDETNKDNLVFRNATAVLEIKTGASVVGVDITAANSIVGPVTASFNDSEVNLATSSLNEKSVFVLHNSAPSDKVFYLATAPVTTGSTTATCYEVNWEGSATKDSKGLQRNAIYSMDLSSLSCDNKSDLTGKKGVFYGHEFVIIKAEYISSGKKSYLKWATKNIGAETEKDYGLYFAWGEKTGHAVSGRPTTNVYDAFPNTGVFRDPPVIDGDQNPSLLPASNDAATIYWGTAWKMPTGGGESGSQFYAMQLATYWAYDATDKGYYVFAPTSSHTAGGKTKNGIPTDLNKNNALLFFPAAGYGTASTLSEPGTSGHYWSRTINSDNNKNACCLAFNKTTSQTPVEAFGGDERKYGFPIRPVSDK